MKKRLRKSCAREPTPNQMHANSCHLREPDGADRLRVFRYNNKFLVDARVAERNHAADPDALLLGGRDLVADALAGDLALELGERQQHVERQPPHAGGRVERLGHRDEGDAVGVEQLHELGEVGERSGQAIDLVDDDNVDLAAPGCRRAASAGRAVQDAAGEAAVVIMISDQFPALMGLALDVGLRGLPLGVERVEVEVKIMLGRFAGIDRAAETCALVSRDLASRRNPGPLARTDEGRRR